MDEKDQACAPLVSRIGLTFAVALVATISGFARDADGDISVAGSSYISDYGVVSLQSYGGTAQSVGFAGAAVGGSITDVDVQSFVATATDSVPSDTTIVRLDPYSFNAGSDYLAMSYGAHLILGVGSANGEYASGNYAYGDDYVQEAVLNFTVTTQQSYTVFDFQTSNYVFQLNAGGTPIFSQYVGGSSSKVLTLSPGTQYQILAGGRNPIDIFDNPYGSSQDFQHFTIDSGDVVNPTSASTDSATFSGTASGSTVDPLSPDSTNDQPLDGSNGNLEFGTTDGSVFTDVTLPDIGSGRMDVSVDGVDLGDFDDGDTVDFSDYSAELGDLLEGDPGVASFEVSGFGAAAAFPVTLSFDNPTASFSVTTNVPEPALIAIIPAGFLALRRRGRRERQSRDHGTMTCALS